MTPQEMTNRYASYSTEMRAEILGNIMRAASETVERRKFPRFVYVGAFSINYQVASEEDWFLKIVVFDTKTKQLKASQVQFFKVHIGAAWDKTDSTFTPLVTPECAGWEIIQGEDCLEFADSLFQALGATSMAIMNNKPLVQPIHKVTGHPLVSEEYFKEDYS